MRTPVAMRPMNDTPATGGWEQSSLRKWMADELPGLLPAELVRHVKAVSKTTNNMNAVCKDAPFSLTQTDDAYWLPSMSELCGAQGPETFSKEYAYLSSLYSNEGAQYQLFGELSISGLTTNEKIVRYKDGRPICWWERTPSADGSIGEDSTVFNRVKADGDAPDEPTYVIPGFCL